MSGVNFSTTPKNVAGLKRKATTPTPTPQAIKRALRQSMMDEVGRGD
jgi:type II secretory pathway component PulM